MAGRRSGSHPVVAAISDGLPHRHGLAEAGWVGQLVHPPLTVVTLWMHCLGMSYA